MIVREVAAADDGVDFFAGFRDALWILEEVINCTGDDAGRRAGSDGHRYNLVDDLLFVERFTGFRVFGVHHGIQHVIFSGSWIGLSIFETFGSILAHGFGGSLEFRLIEKPVYKSRSSWSLDRLRRGSVHRLDHRWFRSRQAIELPAKEAEGSRFQVEPIQFADCRNGRIAAQGAPFAYQFGRTITHLDEAISNRCLSEQRGQNPVMNAPARLVVECAEQGRMHCVSNLHYRPADEFAKALLIAEFLTERHAPHKDNLLAQDGDLEDVA